jgi:hypothetical protein
MIRLSKRRWHQFLGRKQNEDGFIMPTVIILIVIMSGIAYSTLIQANNTLNLSYKQSYIQMAREASKAAIDYAQEQFDNSVCGSYSGTPETALTGSTNNRYKITMQADVLSTSPDGFEKKVVGTGRVYLPKTSASALYVFDIRSEIVRTYAVCKSPDNFAPLVWLDASNTTSLKTSGTATTTLAPITTTGNLASSGDTLEERADNGSQTTASWNSTDLEMNTCNASEFSTSICNSNTSKYLNLGLIYSNVNVPKNAQITSAQITLACATPSGQGGALTDTIYGFYKSSTDPHPDLFSFSGSNQLKTPLGTSGLHTIATSTANMNNCPPSGNQAVFDVTPIVQEIVNNPNWDPSTEGGRLGLILSRTSGTGSHRFNKSGNKLSIAYSTTTVTQANSGNSISEWDDISGNNNNAHFVYGNAPVLVTNQMNGKPIVRFNNSALLSSLSPALSGKQEMTVFAVIKGCYSSCTPNPSSSNGRIVSGTSASVSNDTTAGNSIIPLMGYSGNTGFSNVYSGLVDGTTYQTNYACSTSCASTPYLYVSNFGLNSSSSINSYLRGNGAQVAEKDGIAPSGSPYTYTIDQLYYGGTRISAMPGSGGNYFNGDYAEIVVYPQALTCHQMTDLEDYFRSKWNLANTQWSSDCPADTIPTL